MQSSSVFQSHTPAMQKTSLVLYQVLQMVQYNQIFLHTSYIHIHMGSKTIAKNTKNISPVLGVVCAGVYDSLSD